MLLGVGFVVTPAISPIVKPIWYYAENGEAKGPLSRDDMRALVEAGTITRQTRVWTHSLKAWMSAEDTTLENLFKAMPSTDILPPLPSPPIDQPVPSSAPTALRPEIASSPMSSALPEGFESPRLLAHCITASIVAFTIIIAVGIWSGLRQIELLERIQLHGSFTKEEAFANDTRERIIMVIRLMVYFVTVIFFSCWTYRVAWNVRALGARRLSFTPGWAVGYYFIPILWLWKPYLAMKEIWKASVDPEHWRSKRTAPIVSWWWTLWIFYIVFNYIVTRLTMGAGVKDYALNTKISVATDLLAFPLNAVAVILVQKLSALQTATAARRR